MVKKSYKWLLLLFVLMGVAFIKPDANMHPYHVSAMEIEYNRSAAVLEMSIKIFIDDFENVLKKNYQPKIDLHKNEYRLVMDKLIDDYIKRHIFIINKNKKYTIKLFGWETDKESVIIYATAPVSKLDTSNIEVVNTVLFDFFDDQMNIVHFLVDGKRISEKFYIQKPKMKFNF